jgi:hypothetical protein
MFLATELGMTVSRLRQELTDAEFIHFAAYYELKGKTRTRGNGQSQAA